MRAVSTAEMLPTPSSRGPSIYRLKTGCFKNGALRNPIIRRTIKHFRRRNEAEQLTRNSVRRTFVKKIGSPKLVKGLPKRLATTSNASPVALDVLTFNN